MNFSLCLNMAGFCRAGHTCTAIASYIVISYVAIFNAKNCKDK